MCEGEGIVIAIVFACFDAGGDDEVGDSGFEFFVVLGFEVEPESDDGNIRGIAVFEFWS